MLKKIKNKFSIIYLIGFLFALNIAIPTYINSTFLGNFVPEKVIGIFYTAGSLLTIFLLIWIPIILRKIGNYKITLSLLLTSILTLLILAFANNSVVITSVFIIHLAITAIILFNFDIFLENFSDNGNTGSIRGGYLSIKNVAWVISPLITGFILTNGDYWKIYSISAILLIPIIYLLYKNFRDFKDPEYEKIFFWDALTLIWTRKNLYKIFISNFLLRFFYSWMVIYTPIYLHEHIGFSWGTIGIIFTIMLLPFPILEIPLGKLADRKLGEKEILCFGFIITGLTTIILTFITSNNPAIWASLLFITRIGASMIEITTESYFFKKIEADDTNILSFFRMTRPVAYVVGPLIASVLLLFLSFNYLFAILGIIITIVGLSHSLTLKDTK